MIETMKQVLEVLEENLVWFSKDTMIGKALRKKTESAIATLRQSIAEAEKQKPVAWMTPTKDLFSTYKTAKTGCGFGVEPIPLYTHPPKREWVGLTDEEWVNALGKVREQLDGDVFGGFYRAIEAKLKAKNGFSQTEKNT